MVNLLHVVHFPVFGGPHNQALRLAPVLGRAGWHTTVLLPHEPGDAASRLRNAGIATVTLPLGRLRASPDPRTQARFLFGLAPEVARIRSLLRERSFDLVVVAGLVNPHAALAARLAGVPLVWQILDTRPPVALRRAMMPLVSCLADAVMTTGLITGRLHPGTEALADRLHPFFPPVDCDHFRPSPNDRAAVRAEWGLSHTDIVIGSTSNISPQKGIEYLIDAVPLLRAGGFPAKLVLVGQEYETHRGYSSSLRQRLATRRLVEGEDVLFVGSRPDVERQLQGFDVFLMASVPRSEGVPTSILEAMSCGLAVIATDVGGISEVVEDEVTGFVVPPLNPNAIAAATLRLLQDPALRSRMGEEGRRRAVERYDVSACAETHLRAFEAAISHHAARRTRPRPAPAA